MARLHRSLARLPFVALAALLVSAAAGHAEGPPEPAVAAPQTTRALKVGLGAQWLPANPFGDSRAAGPCLVGAYEFLLSPRFALGIVGGVRQFFGREAANQLVYGLVLKHGLREPLPAVSFRPYLQYGLLQQISRQAGHTGASVSYDAGLTAGADLLVGLPVPLFAEVAFHVSHLSAIDAQARSASYFEVLVGPRFSW
jgi:hypothetical protein